MEIKKIKRVKINGFIRKEKDEPKVRELYYSAHIDRYIFQYYSQILNELYNERVQKDNICNVAIAYRNNLEGKCNIDFAKTAFDFIKKNGECWIIIGDFSKFFDKLDHKYLKERLLDIMKNGDRNFFNIQQNIAIDNNKLPSDYYAVFKNITKFAYCDIDDILKFYNISKKRCDIKKFNNDTEFIELNKLKQNSIEIHKNKNNFGICQGSCISAILSNIYMLDIDRQLNEIILQTKGLFMRYSDDFIIVLPSEKFETNFSKINEILKNDKSKLILQPDKTNIYYYKNQTIFKKQLNTCNIEEETLKTAIHYLGFSFNGNDIKIRDKTTSKYYYRMYKKTDTIVTNKRISKKNNFISCKILYEKYSMKGAHPVIENKTSGKFKGNFLTYVDKAISIFGEKEKINLIKLRHMRKIRKRLNLIKSNINE